MQHHNVRALLLAPLLLASCDASSPLTSSSVPEPLAGTAPESVRAQALPAAVFMTTPRDVEGVIAGKPPLEVEFNLCRSRPGDPDDDLKYTFDFDADGDADSFGHCRARQTYTASGRARVCVSDRRPDGVVCRDYEIRSSVTEPDDERPIDHVLRMTPTSSCGTVPGLQYHYVATSISPPIPAGQEYSLAFTVDRIGPNEPPATTEATFYDIECLPIEWAQATVEPSPLPNDHVATMRRPACPHAQPRIYVELRTPTEEAPRGLTFQVTDFRVPGRNVRIEGPTRVECR